MGRARPCDQDTRLKAAATIGPVFLKRDKNFLAVIQAAAKKTSGFVRHMSFFRVKNPAGLVKPLGAAPQAGNEVKGPLNGAIAAGPSQQEDMRNAIVALD